MFITEKLDKRCDFLEKISTTLSGRGLKRLQSDIAEKRAPEQFQLPYQRERHLAALLYWPAPPDSERK